MLHVVWLKYVVGELNWPNGKSLTSVHYMSDGHLGLTDLLEWIRLYKVTYEIIGWTNSTKCIRLEKMYDYYCFKMHRKNRTNQT